MNPPSPNAAIPVPAAPISRRSFFTKAFTGGLTLTAGVSSIAEEIERVTQRVNRNSSPSKLQITDLRIAEIASAPMRVPLIRIDTNQGIHGLGEVRDGGSPRYALLLKSRLLGENPCNVEKIFKKIKQFGHHGRQGGGVSGVEMALWDLAGKAYGVPVYQLLGGKYRDAIRIYADTTESRDPDVFGKRMKERVAMGITFLKMDLGIHLVRDIPGALNLPAHFDWRSYNQTEHPFTRVQITDKGLEKMAEFVAAVRQAVGYEIPLAADHFGHIDVNSCIRLGRKLEPYQMAWLEDLVPWQYTDMLREITQAIDVPTLTGEDIYLKEEFIKLINGRAVDMIHPDLATAGGILETKKIGDYGEEHGVPMAMHFAGSPVSFMANVHCAAATRNFVALEHHSLEVPWWENLVQGIEKPIVRKGFVPVPDAPGLGIDLNEPVIREHLREGAGYFEPTPGWDTERSNDRLWS
jgi:L-alanine-DL-glutamate epimerase-like enolase superfamily enzyme